jgi:hypothetical protein
MIQNKMVHTNTVKHQKGRKELARHKKGKPEGRRKRLETFHRLLRKGDRLCGLVVRVLGYRSGGPGSIPGTTKKKKK